METSEILRNNSILQSNSKGNDFSFLESLKHQTIQNFCTTKLKSLERRNARICQGMSPEPDFLNEKNLSLQYEQFPKVRTKAELMTNRKNQDVLNEISLQYLLENHQNAEERLKEREEKYRISPYQRKTFSQVSEERKKKDMEYNEKIFGNVTIGIHKKELPKFEIFRKHYLNNGEENQRVNTPETFPCIKPSKKSKSVDIPFKPNEINPVLINPNCYNENDMKKYRRKFEISKIQKILLKELKFTNLENKKSEIMKPQKSRRFKGPRQEKNESMCISLNHIRSKAFK